jgi:hypothetical protein
LFTAIVLMITTLVGVWIVIRPRWFLTRKLRWQLASDPEPSPAGLAMTVVGGIGVIVVSVVQLVPLSGALLDAQRARDCQQFLAPRFREVWIGDDGEYDRDAIEALAAENGLTAEFIETGYWAEPLRIELRDAERLVLVASRGTPGPGEDVECAVGRP